MNSNFSQQTVNPPWQHSATAQPVTKSVKVLANELFGRILADAYPFGTRLPAERQLAVEFGVSRNTVRQALGLMESHAVVSRRAGSGSFVTFRSPEPGSAKAEKASNPIGEVGINLSEIAEITSPLELNVVRSIVEPEIVRLAVINMSARDIEKLRGCLAELEGVKTSAADFSDKDLEFHLQLARGTHNPLLIGLYEIIDHVRRHAHWARTKEKVLSPNRIRDYQDKHRSIFEAIEARDIESAVEFTKLHMTEVQRDLMHDI